MGGGVFIFAVSMKTGYRLTVARGSYEMAEGNGSVCTSWGDTDKYTFCKLKNLKH